MKAWLRGLLATLVGSVALLVASSALADGEACFNDIDCPGTACGDAVCNWSKAAAKPDGDKAFACNPAGSQASGSDGWCTTTADCKCASQGATCTAPYCTFTKPKAGVGGSGSGGSASTAGASSTGGVSSTAGTTVMPAVADKGGGCSLSAPSSNGAAWGVALLGLGFVLTRRRR